MQRVVMIAAGLVSVAGVTTANAADLPARAPAPYTAPPPIAAIYNWGGFYVGIEADLAAYDASSTACPPCTTANGCFRKVNQNGGTTLPVGHELAPRDRARRRDGARDLPELQDPARRGELELVREPRHRGERGGRARRERRLELLRRRRVLERDAPTRHVLQPSRASRSRPPRATAATASSIPAASQYVTAVGGTTLSLNADNTLGERDGLERRRLGLLGLRAEARLADRHRLLASGRSPTSRPTPTRTPAPRSTTRSALGRRRLVPGRRHEPRVAARRRGLRAHREHERQLRLGAVRARRVAPRRHLGQQRQLQPVVPLHRRRRLRRPDRASARRTGSARSRPARRRRTSRSRASPSSRTVAQGGGTTYAVTVAPANGFSDLGRPSASADSRPARPAASARPRSASGEPRPRR